MKVGFNFLYILLLAFLFSISLKAQVIGGVPIHPAGNDHTKTIQAQTLWTGQSLGLNLTGAGQTIYQWEAPLAGNSHPDSTNSYLSGRVSAADALVGFSSHATEMAQIMIGRSNASPYGFLLYRFLPI
jgi:hypothetical protein